VTFDYDSLPPGIRETVRWVHSFDYETSDSGDGLTNQAAGMECAQPWAVPMVAVVADNWEHAVCIAQHLWAELRTLSNGDPDERWRIEASYSPTDGQSLVLLTGIDDAGLAAAREAGG